MRTTKVLLGADKTIITDTTVVKYLLQETKIVLSSLTL